MMKWGKFEIDCLALLIIGFAISMIVLTICASNERIEEERTKQLMIQHYIIIEKEIEDNGTSN